MPFISNRTYFKIVFIWLLSFPLFANESGKLTIVAPHEAKLIGNIANLITASYENLGLKIDIIYLPAQRSLIEAKKNTWVDGELIRVESATKLLTEFIKVPTQIISIELAAYTLTDSVVIDGWSSFEQYKVASMRGLIYVDQKIQEHQLNDIQLLTTAAQAFELLRINRVDTVLLPKLIAEKYMNEHKFMQFNETLIEALPIYHYIHRRHEKYVQPLAAELAKQIHQSK